jgi:choline-sulfatase
MSQTPNILWIQTDETRPDAWGWYGSVWAKTPNLDLLAAHGVVMKNCVCQSPVCVPSRSSQLTGLYPQECNVLFNNEVAWRDNIFPKGTVTFPEIFARAGYETVSLGKWHTPNHPTWEQAKDYELIKKYADFIEMGPGYPDEKFQVVHRPGIHKIIIGGTYPSREENPSRILTNQAIDYLRDRRRDRPFLLRVSHNWPHTPVLPPPPFNRTYQPDEIPIQYFDEQAYRMRAAYDRTIADAQRMRELTREQVREIWKDYMGLCTYVDYEIGRLLAALRALGLEKDTVIMYSADHGRALGEFGHGEKGTFDDQVWRVPFIWSWPGHLPENQVREDLCELVDTGRTLLALAGIGKDAPVHWRGRDLFGDPIPPPENQAVFGQIGWPNVHAPLLMEEKVIAIRRNLAQVMGMELDAAYPCFSMMRIAVRTPRNRMDVSWMKDGRRLSLAESDGNFFDLRSDPFEKRNLWNDPSSRPVIDQLMKRLEIWFEGMDKPERIFGLTS